MSAIVEACLRGDLDTLDRLAEAAGGGRAVLRALLDQAPVDARRAIEARLPPEPAGASFVSRLDVRALVAAGPLALWVTSAWVLRVLPGHERMAPAPVHEQWDALLEIHRGRPEAPWLPIELLASLEAEQRPLGRRILLGLKPRFGSRAARIAAARVRIGGAALIDLLERAAAFE